MTGGARISARRLLAAGAAAALLAFAPAQASPPLPDATVQELGTRIAHARDQVLPYVVSILVVRETHANGMARRDVSGGSGTLITAEGHVVTNAHVTDNGRAFRVIFADRSELPAKLVGEDTLSDIAVLKVQAPPGKPFRFARFATDARPASGDTVLAMGSPWGFSQSLSVGVVNNPERLLVSLFQDEADYEASLGPDQPTARYYAWIQHDAPIAPGNSGGPLVALDGQVIGVSTRGNLLGGDLAFAIPAADAAAIAAKLIEHGRVPRAWLGFKLRSLAGTGLAQGALVNAVSRDSPAHAQGIRAGDRILAVDGEPLQVLRPEQVPAVQRRFAELAVGSKVKLEVAGAGGNRSVTLVAVAHPSDRGSERELARWGVTLAELTPAMARRRGFAFDTGLLVTGVRPGGPAATATPALLAGDVVRALDRNRPLARFDDLPPEGGGIGEPLVLSVDRGGEQLLTLVTPEDPDSVRTPQHELPRPWSGVEVQVLAPALASRVGAPQQGGFRITRVYPGGPFARAGLVVGDVVTEVDGQPLRAAGAGDTTVFQRRIRDADPDVALPVTYMRDGRTLTARVQLADGPRAESAMSVADIDRLGAVVRELSFFDRNRRRLNDEQRGVLVQSVERGGLAGLAHLAEDDLILRVGERDVTDIAAFREAFEAALADETRTPVFLVLRGTETRLLFLDRAWLAEPEQ